MVSYAQKHTRTNPANYPSCARSLARTRARAHTHRHAPTRSHRFAAKPSQLPIARTQTYQHAPTHWHRFAAKFLERLEAEFAEQPARRQTTVAVLQEALRLQTELLEAAVEQACDSGFRVATRPARVACKPPPQPLVLISGGRLGQFGGQHYDRVLQSSIRPS